MTDTDQDIAVAADDPLFGGDTARIADTVTDEAGDPLDLTSAQTVEFEIFDELGGTSQLTKTDSDSAVTITGADDNVAQIDLTESETEDLAPARGAEYYEYRVRVVDVDGDPDTVTTGDLAVRAS